MTVTEATTLGAHQDYGLARSQVLPRADLYFQRATTDDDERRIELLEALLARSLSDDGFDWDALSRVDAEAWGHTDAD